MRARGDTKPAFVLASEATKQATRVRDCLRGYVEVVELRIPRIDRHGYLEEDLEGIRVVEFDQDSFLEGPLGRTYHARFERRKKRFAEDPGVSRYEQLIPFILAEAHAAALGAATKLGEEFVERARDRRRSKAQHEPTSLERLLIELAVTYKEVPYYERSLIFLRVTDRDIVFLAEPSLSPVARQQAARLLLSGKKGGKSRASRRPLRWNAPKNAWRRLPKNWAEESQLKHLLDEIRTTTEGAGHAPGSGSPES